MVVRNHVLVGESGEIHLQVPPEWNGREVEVLLMPVATAERELERARFDAFVQEHGSAVGDWSFARDEVVQKLVDEGLEDVRKGKVISNQDALAKIRSWL